MPKSKPQSKGERSKSYLNRFLRQLLATAFIAGGMGQVLVLPSYAVGTTSGTAIKNTATATYDDPNNPGTPINATSNEVTITVADVSGLTNIPAGFTDSNGGSIQGGDTLYFDFKVTNTSNSTADIFITGAPSLTGATLTSVKYSSGGTSFNTTTNTTVPGAGATASGVAEDGILYVRVEVVVSAGASTVNVTLGNTGANDNSAGTQDQLDSADGSNADEVRTTSETINKEASAFQSANVVAIFNGPNSQPKAVGPTDNNDDFTVVTTPIPAGADPTTSINPDPVSVVNTVRNEAPTTQSISILPTAPSVASSVPTGTIVMITNATSNTAAAISAATQKAVYTYNGTAFVWQASATDGAVTYTSVNTSATAPVTVSVATNTDVNYTKTFNLPTTAQLTKYPVPITAFVDTNGNGTPDTFEAQNKTIENVYTGVLSLVKTARILDTDGTTAVTGFLNSTLPADAATLNAALTPGRYIEYKIQYTNISEAQTGSNTNVTFSATNVVLTESGVLANSNWATDQDNLDGDSNVATGIDTSHKLGSANASVGSIQFFSGASATNLLGGEQTGTTAVTDVTKYINTVGTVAPQGTGTFTFIRKLN